MNIFMKRILSIIPWVAALLVIRAIKIKKINRELKTLEQLEEKNIDENNYIIQEEGWLGILFLVGTIFFSLLLLYGFIDGQATFSVILAYGILIAFSGICTIHLFLWRVKVNHDVIEYRSLFGKKYYKFSDITRSVHKENGALEIYAGDKKIFKFDENISTSLFENSLYKHKILQETWLGCRDKECAIRPKESHYVLPGIFFLYLVYNSVILISDAKETAFVFLLFSLVPGGIFFYSLMDKTIVRDGWLYRNGFLRKNCKIKLTDITRVERRKNLFGETLILYKDQKKIARISARNRNVDWLQVKIAEIKKEKKKLKRKK